MTDRARFDLTGPLPTGRAAIEASAGTGKTYTLAGLAVRYVAEEAVPINELLVVTFTRAAAAELRDRVRTRLTYAAEALRSDAATFDDELLTHLAASDREIRAGRIEAAVTDFDAATITTIHGFAQQVLTTLGSTAPGDLDATLVDDARDLVTQVSADVLAATAIAEPSVVEELPKNGRLMQLVLTVLGNPGLALVPGPEAEESNELSARYRRLVDWAVDEVHRRRRDAGTMSFDDVLTQLRDALRDAPAAAASLQRRYQVALIDEFQDTDPVQWQIFSTLFGGEKSDTSLVLVGDPKQAIYAFRGANVHTYLEAAYEPGTARTTLGTNWRSDEALLGALQRLLEGATFGDPRIGFVDVETAPKHEHRRLHTIAGAPLPALSVRTALSPDLERNQKKPQPINTPEATSAIARDLARQVQLLLEDATRPGDDDTTSERVRPHDIAVLVGTHADAALMQAALLRQGIPAVAHRGGSVLETPAAIQWRWLLTALTQPSDAYRARTAALSWFFGWSAEDIDTASDTELAGVQEQLYRWADTLETRGVVDFCAAVWSESAVTRRVLEAADGDRNLTDLDHLAQLLQASASGHRPGPVALLASLALLEEANRLSPDLDNDVTARRIESEAEAVQIMTVYAAKGLEFPVVCVPTLWKNNFSRRECIYQDPATGERTLDVTKAIKPAREWPTKAECKGRKALAELEAVGENLRLLYVALTWAQHQTIVWWSRGDGSDATGLARLLFARDEGGALLPDVFDDKKVPLPDDAEALARLEPLFAPVGDAVRLGETGRADGYVPQWEPDDAAGAAQKLALAQLGRELERPHRRWSFSAISDRSHTADFDPDDESLGDAGAADEPDVDDDVVLEAADPVLTADGRDPVVGSGPTADPLVSDLPLGAVPGGASFGTLVHELLEHVDFAAADLDAELQARIDDRKRWSPAAVLLGDELRVGLRHAIETPLGPLFDGRRLCDLTQADRLDELTFELRLGEGGRHATDREIGALMADRLPAGDPLRPWAEELAAGLFDVSLAGHLTGSIDAIFRIKDPTELFAPERFVIVDYKTNLLAERGRPPQSADYHPDRLPAAMEEHHYPLQALLYSVALHRYLRWRLPTYDPAVNLGGAAYLFLRGMTGADTPIVDGRPHGVFGWAVPPQLVTDLSDLLDGQLVEVAGDVMSTPAPLLDRDTAALEPFVVAGVLDAAVHVAGTIARAVGGLDPDALLGAALAARAPSFGHVCVVPGAVAASIVLDDTDAVAIDGLPWPEPGAWAASLAASAAVRAPDDPANGITLPLVWDGTRLYLERYWRFERRVAEDLLRRARATGGLTVESPELTAILDRLFDPAAAAGPDLQRRAATLALTQHLAVIAGGPGTGKTRTIARLLAAAHHVANAAGRAIDVALAAPTGKASARMTQAVHEEVTAAGETGAVAEQLLATEATTIHRLLGSTSGVEFRHDASNPLPHDLVVVDETSMVSLPLMARLLAAVRPDATLVLVGDPYQLASVEAGAVLGEIVGSTPEERARGPLVERVVLLERVHRFGEDSAIAALADAVRTGDADQALELLRDDGADELTWIHDDNTAGIAAVQRVAAAHAVEVITAARRPGDAEQGLQLAAELKVLNATRLGPLGTYRFGDRIEVLASRDLPPGTMQGRWYVGRPIIVTHNDYPNRLVNGDVGLVVAGAERPVVVFVTGDGIRELAVSQLDAIETWWAMTIHKSQGSEFRQVVITLPPAPSPILTRELLYTAVTRAKERVTIVASEASLRAAIARPVARASGLADRLHPA